MPLSNNPGIEKYADKIENDTYYFTENQKKDIQDYYDAIKDLDEYKDSELLNELKSALDYAKEHTWTVKQAKNEIKYHKETISKNGKTETINIINGKSTTGNLYDEKLLNQIESGEYYKINGEFIPVSEYNKQYGITENQIDTVDSQESISLTSNTANNIEDNGEEKCTGDHCKVKKFKHTESKITQTWNSDNNIKQTFETIPETNNKIEKITDNNFYEILKKRQYTLVDFWQTGCPPCERMHGIIKSVTENYNGDKVTIGKMDISLGANTQIATKYKIEQTPTLLLFDQNGNVQPIRFNPYVTENDILNAIENL